jgi:hypothetical protein
MREIRIQAKDLFALPLAGEPAMQETGLRFIDEADAVRWIEQEQSRFEHCGYNRLHGYWWAQGRRNDAKRYRWWIVAQAAELAA